MNSIDLSPQRPEPRADEATGPFFEALKEHRLVVQACPACRTRQLGRWRCIACDSTALEWLPATGKAVLQSFAVVRANGNPHFNAGGPYNIAIVELAEGPQIYANIVNADPAHLRIGMPLMVMFSTLDSGAVAPVFAPA